MTTVKQQSARLLPHWCQSNVLPRTQVTVKANFFFKGLIIFVKNEMKHEIFMPYNYQHYTRMASVVTIND